MITVRYRNRDGDVEKVDNMTLAEKGLEGRLFMQNEQEEVTFRPRGEIVELRNCESIGYVHPENGETIVNRPVGRAEQVEDDLIEIEFSDGEVERVEGNLDRGYNY